MQEGLLNVHPFAIPAHNCAVPHPCDVFVLSQGWDTTNPHQHFDLVALPCRMITLRIGMKFSYSLLVPALATAFAAAAYAQTSAKPADDLPTRPRHRSSHDPSNGPTVVMDTSMGRITCQFFQHQAPKAVANFIALAEGTRDWTDPVTNKKQHNKPLYNGTIFHRVIPSS